MENPMNRASATRSLRNTFPGTHRHDAAASIQNVASSIRAALRSGSSVVWIGTDTGLRWLEVRLETPTGGVPAFAFEALLKSFVRSRSVLSYRACAVDLCRRELTTRPGRNRWGIVEACASLAVPIPFDHTPKECT
jgi:hypothetical protein